MYLGIADWRTVGSKFYCRSKEEVHDSMAHRLQVWQNRNCLLWVYTPVMHYNKKLVYVSILRVWSSTGLHNQIAPMESSNWRVHAGDWERSVGAIREGSLWRSVAISSRIWREYGRKARQQRQQLQRPAIAAGCLRGRGPWHDGPAGGEDVLLPALPHQLGQPLAQLPPLGTRRPSVGVPAHEKYLCYPCTLTHCYWRVSCNTLHEVFKIKIYQIQMQNLLEKSLNFSPNILLMIELTLNK